MRNVTIAALMASGILFAGTASAQDYSKEPTYGTISLSAGFQPDPHEVDLRAGGSIDVADTLGAGCAGTVADAPDYDLLYDSGSGSLPLIITVRSFYDTTLVINTPDGDWICDDDSGPGDNPSIRFDPGRDGLYDIWVGTYDSGSLQDATLMISELEASEE